MNLHENIYRIQSLLTEDRDEMMKNMIDKYGWYHVIKLMGGYDSKLDEYVTNENIVDLVKSIVTKLCEDADDIEVGGFDFGTNPIIYGETLNQQHLISYYRPEGVVIERYGTEDEDEEFEIDTDDNYLGSYVKRYESLSPSLLTEILHLLLTQI